MKYTFLAPVYNVAEAIEVQVQLNISSLQTINLTRFSVVLTDMF